MGTCRYCESGAMDVAIIGWEDTDVCLPCCAYLTRRAVETLALNESACGTDGDACDAHTQALSDHYGATAEDESDYSDMLADDAEYAAYGYLAATDAWYAKRA